MIVKVKWTIFGNEKFLSTIQLELGIKTISSTKGQMIRIGDENHFVHKRVECSKLGMKTILSTNGRIFRIGDENHFIHKGSND